MTPQEIEMARREEERKKREAARSKVAQSQISATPIQAGRPMMQASAGGGGQNPLQQVGMQIGKKLIGTALGGLGGPLGGLLGGLFNKGGAVKHYNQGGLARDPITGELLPYNVLATRMMQRRSAAKAQQQNGRVTARNNARTGPSVQGNIFDGYREKKNMGGPLAKNPYGYNEGGAAMETPIKKVMDEQKLEQQAMAFELEQKRKQETHEQSMRIKEQQAKQAAAMKKASATTNKTASKPKGPLSK